MYPDCRCNDELGSLTYVGESRLTGPFDEVFDEPDELGLLAYADDDGLDLGALSYVGFEDDEVGGFGDVFDAGVKLLDKLSGGAKGKAKKAQQQASRERLRADQLEDELARQQRQVQQAAERQRVAEARRLDAQRRREMADLERQLVDMRGQQAVVRSRINKEKAAQRKRWLWIGGGLLAAGTAATVGVSAVRAARGPAR